MRKMAAEKYQHATEVCLSAGFQSWSFESAHVNHIGKDIRRVVLSVILTLAFANSLGQNLSAKKALILLVSETTSFHVPVRTWKSLRDDRIVKQDLDYSCGAAALATLLNEFYGQSVTEEKLLNAMDKGDMRASFDDMRRVLPQFGFRAQGFAASYAQLSRLKIPVVVYLKHRKDDHFAVLRGISKDSVWLADPSLGNRTYSREQFLEMWETRQGLEGSDLHGKFLAVFPEDGNLAPASPFFTKEPLRQSAPALEQINVRFTG